MAVTVRIPTTLRPLSGGASTVEVEAGALGDVIKALDAAHPGFADRLLDDDGNLRKFVNVFVDDDDVRYLDGLATNVPDGQTVSHHPRRRRRLTRPVAHAARSGRHRSQPRDPGAVDPVRRGRDARIAAACGLLPVWHSRV